MIDDTVRHPAPVAGAFDLAWATHLDGPVPISDAICWNGMTEMQQDALTHSGYIYVGEYGGGDCPNPAEVEVELGNPRTGPRYYCESCAQYG